MLERAERVRWGFRNLSVRSDLGSIDGVMKKSVFTACVPAFGGFTLPSVIAFQISSIGTSSSVQGTVNSGESHRTIDDGSSYRISRFSRL